MRRFAIVLLAVFSIVFTSSVLADTTAELLQVNVTVPDQSSAAFQTGLQTAFVQAAIQVSNDPQISTKPIFQNAEKNVMQFVQSYQYIQQPPNTILQIMFDRAALQAALNQTTAIAQNTAAPTQQTTSSLALTIVGIQNMTDYENALQTLRAISGVSKVAAGEITGDQVEFVIKLADNMDSNQFKQNLLANNHFRASTEDHYFWVGNQA